MERPNGHVKRKRRNSQAYAQCCARRISTRLLQSSRQVLEQKERLPEQLSADRDTRVAVFNGDREELVNLLRKLKTDLPYNVCAKKYRLVQHRFSGPLTIPHDEGEMTAKDPLNQSIRRQRTVLAGMFQTVFQRLAATCAEVWRERDKLNEVLSVALKTMPNCKFLYAMNPKAVQISDNISSDGPITADFGRDRSRRPYIREVGPGTSFFLSQAYLSLRAKRPSLTAIQVVTDRKGAVLGYIGADFDLRDLPLTRDLYEEPRYWRQIKGDPSIRGSVFHQTRFESDMDRQIDTVNGVAEALMVDHGGFHLKLHFSSSRAVLWLMDDPYRYRLLDIQALVDPDTCLAYPKRPYSSDAMITADRIRPVLEGFKELRFLDEMLYLRSGTLNIFNGIVGLTFSCDGSHYIPFDEFLNRDSSFWLGASGT